jgi:hypothetical protein
VPVDRRTRVVLNHLEAVCDALEEAIHKSATQDEWRDASRGVLLYWLGILYDEGAGYTKDLETSLSILRTQLEKIREHKR